MEHSCPAPALGQRRLKEEQERQRDREASQAPVGKPGEQSADQQEERSRLGEDEPECAVRVERLLVVELRALLDAEDPFTGEQDLRDHRHEQDREVVAQHRPRTFSNTRQSPASFWSPQKRREVTGAGRRRPHARTRETKTRASRASAAEIEREAEAGPAALSVISVRLLNVMTMSVTKRAVLPSTSMRTTPRKRAERVPTCGNGTLAKETILAPAGSPLASVRRRQGTAARGITDRRQSSRTMRRVLRTSATLPNSRPLRLKVV